jgi:hypothetical protein
MFDLLVKAVNGNVVRYPYFLADMRAEHPNTSFPEAPPVEMLASYNVYPVERSEHPSYDPEAHRPVEGQPEFAGGKWKQKWNLRAANAEEVQQAAAAKEAARAEQVRNSLRNELAGTQPPQSVPGLVARIEKLEKILGIQPV